MHAAHGDSRVTRRLLPYWVPVLALSGFLLQASTGALSPSEIVRRSVMATERDWDAAPKWAFTEQDVDLRHNSRSTRTYEVVMIDGSPYNILIAANEQRLSAADRDKEFERLRSEIRKRHAETPDERAKRISAYQRERKQDHALLLEMINAFTFTPAGVESIRGRDAYVFEATPRPDYVPKKREDKILAGMQGRLYVDKETFQWARVEAEVVKPVVFFGFLAKVQPGTHFVLEQAPVNHDLWLPVRFTESINVKALAVIEEQKSHEEAYSNYRPMREAFAALGVGNESAASTAR
jgi:hypothetical protein